MQNNIKSITNKFNSVSIFCKNLRAKFDKYVTVLAKKIHKWGVSANTLSFIGLIIGLFAVNFLSFEHYFYALLCILANRFFDILDGSVAKLSKVTKYGVFLDSAFDYIFYSAAIFGFALAIPEYNALPAAFLLFSFLAVSATLLAYGIIDYNHEDKKKKSRFYFEGFIQSGEIFAALILACLFPFLFGLIAYITGVLCLIKTLSIIAAAYYNFVIQKNNE